MPKKAEKWGVILMSGNLSQKGVAIALKPHRNIEDAVRELHIIADNLRPIYALHKTVQGLYSESYCFLVKEDESEWFWLNIQRTSHAVIFGDIFTSKSKTTHAMMGLPGHKEWWGLWSNWVQAYGGKS